MNFVRDLLVKPTVEQNENDDVCSYVTYVNQIHPIEDVQKGVRINNLITNATMYCNYIRKRSIADFFIQNVHIKCIDFYKFLRRTII